MSDNNIINENADAQENAPVAENNTAPEASAATTNAPVVEPAVAESIPQPVAATPRHRHRRCPDRRPAQPGRRGPTRPGKATSLARDRRP